MNLNKIHHIIALFSMIKKIAYHLLPITFLFLISIIIYHVWFFNLSPITYGDWTIDHIEKVREKFSLPFIWTTDNGFGVVNYGIVFWPLQMLQGFFAQFISNPALMERIFILWPVVLITPLSMYFLSYYILNSRISSVVSAIVFTFNTVMIVSRSGPLLLHMATTFTPFYFLFFIKALDSKKPFFALAASLVGFIISFWEFRVFYIVLWLLFFYFIYHLFIEKKDRTNIKIYILAGLSVIIPIVLNLYALLGLQKVQSLVSNEIFKQTLFGAGYLKLSKIMILFHYAWTGGSLNWKNQFPPLRFFLVAIIPFLGFVLSRNKKVAFFAFLAGFGIFLTKLTLPPFPNVYQWLFDHLPGFNAFRESGKFGYFITLSYAILAGAFIKGLLNLSKKPAQKAISFIVALGVIFLFLWNIKPVITGELGTLYVPRQIPSDYITLKKFVLNQSGYFKTLWVPATSQWGIHVFNHPMISNFHTNYGLWKKLDKGNIFGANFSEGFLNLSSIKYVIIPIEDRANDNNFFLYMGKRKNFIDQINKLIYLKKINIGLQEIIVYENQNYRPHLYLTEKGESTYKSISYHKINFSFINPTEYKISLKNISAPFYLNFSESFHPDWKIRVGQFNWFKVLTNKNYFLSDKNHFQNDAELNSFYLDSKVLCNNKICSNINLTLYFKPQSYVYIGLIISGIVFTFTIIFFIITILKK